MKNTITDEEIEYQNSKPYSFKDLECSLDYRIKENERLRKMLRAKGLELAEVRLDLKRAENEYKHSS